MNEQRSHTSLKPMPNAVANAYQIVGLWEALQDARAEIDRLRDYERKYHELLNESLRHGEKMMVGWMDLLLSDRVTIHRTDEVKSHE